MADLKELVIKGPDPEKHRVVRWRCVDLCEEIARRYSVNVEKGTVGRWLRKLKLTRLQPRPYHPKKSAETQKAFERNFAGLVKGALLTATASPAIEIWFQDEARVGQQGWIPYIWAPIGARPSGSTETIVMTRSICLARSARTAAWAPQ